MINASTAICVAKRHRPVSNATTTGAIPTFTSNQRPLRRKRSAKKDRKSTRLNSSHLGISYAVFCLKKKSSRLALFPLVPFVLLVPFAPLFPFFPFLLVSSLFSLFALFPLLSSGCELAPCCAPPGLT